jgi:ankyrin repeat protein
MLWRFFAKSEVYEARLLSAGILCRTYAVSFNQTQAVQVLLSHDADPNLDSLNRSTGLPVTPLQSAAHMGNLRVASLLIGAGARINAAGPTGRTALQASLIVSKSAK